MAVQDMYPYISALTPAQIPQAHYQARFVPGSMGSTFKWGGAEVSPWEMASQYADAAARMRGQWSATMMNQNSAYQAAERSIQKRLGEIMGGDEAPQSKAPAQKTSTQASPHAEAINYWDNVRNIKPGQNTGTGGGSPTIPQA